MIGQETNARYPLPAYEQEKTRLRLIKPLLARLRTRKELKSAAPQTSKPGLMIDKWENFKSRVIFNKFPMQWLFSSVFLIFLQAFSGSRTGRRKMLQVTRRPGRPRAARVVHAASFAMPSKLRQRTRRLKQA